MKTIALFIIRLLADAFDYWFPDYQCPHCDAPIVGQRKPPFGCPMCGYKWTPQWWEK